MSITPFRCHLPLVLDREGFGAGENWFSLCTSGLLLREVVAGTPASDESLAFFGHRCGLEGALLRRISFAGRSSSSKEPSASHRMRITTYLPGRFRFFGANPLVDALAMGNGCGEGHIIACNFSPATLNLVFLESF